MPTANIDRFMLRVDNDLSTVPTAGEPVDEVSATASSALHHRLTPYYERPRRAHMLRVGFKLKHPNPADVRYVSDSSVQPMKKTWKGTMDVPAHRLRSNGPAHARQLGVKTTPTSKVTRQIECEFWVVARRNYEKQSWDKHPGDTEHGDTCVLQYTLAP